MESLNESSGHRSSRQAHHEGGPVIKQYMEERIVDIKGQKKVFLTRRLQRKFVTETGWI